MRNLFRRLGAVMLVLCLLMTTLPMGVLAEGLDSVDGVTDVSDKVSYDSRASYDYDGNPVIFAPQYEGIVEWMVIYSDSTGEPLDDAPSDIGSYTVQMIGKGTDCYANITHSFRIVEGKIGYSVSNYSGTYDGQAHSISLTVSTPDVAVYYAVSAEDEYSTDKPMFTEPGTYTVYYSLEKECYVSVSGAATVTLAPGTIAYSIGGFDGTDEFSVAYDGKAHAISLNVTTPGVSASYATNAEGPFSATMPSFTEANEYVVFFKLEKQGYQSETGSVTVAIAPADVSAQVTFNNQPSYPYTGSPVDFAPSCEGIRSWSYTYLMNGKVLDAAPSAPGSYTVEITGEGTNCYAQVTHTYSITPAGIQYTASGYSGVYDGKAHTITVEVTTEGAAVTYATSADGTYTASNPAFTDAGTYTVWYHIEKDSYTPVTGSATVTITPADIQYTASGYSSVYDGKAHTITVAVTTEGAAVTYATSADGTYTASTPAFTDAGTYTVWYRIEKDNYTPVTGSATVTITPAGLQYTASGYSGVYDGKAHTITVEVITEGAAVTYATSADGTYTASNPAFTDAGTYTVWYRIEKDNYTPVTGSATVVIEKVDVSDQVTFNKQDTYPYIGASVVFLPVCDGITDWTITYRDQRGAPLSKAPSKAGSYSVEMKGEGTNCIAQVTHDYSIVQEEIAYTVSGYTGAYDGLPHTITVNVTTPDATVTYATLEGGTYSDKNPEFTDVGTYTVYYKVERWYCETKTGAATVTITKADLSDKVTFDKQDSYLYTGSPVVFSPACDGIIGWKYTHYDKYGTKLSSAPSEVGSYTVEMSGTGLNGIAKVTHAYAIVPRTIEYTVNSYNGVYDGQPHAITVNVTTPDATVTYATSKNGTYTEKNPEFTDAGQYTIYFQIQKQSFVTIFSSATVTITKADMSDKVSVKKQDAYDYTGDPVTFAPTCEGITSWTITYSDESGWKLTVGPSAPGNYKVIMEGEGANCYALVSHSYSIRAPQGDKSDSVLEYTVKDYDAEYDGKAHSIDLTVPRSDATVTYATSQYGTYSTTKPEFTDVGSYEVFFRIEQPGSGTVYSSATVKITKCTPKLYFTPGNIVFQPGEKSRQLKWVYTGDGTLYFTSSDSRHFWVDPSGGLVSLNQEGGVSIWVTASETRNCKSVTAMCIVETESTLPQIDIDTKIDNKLEASDLLVNKVGETMLYYAPENLRFGVSYLNISLYDRTTNQEIHGVKRDVDVSYEQMQVDPSVSSNVTVLSVLHETQDGSIESVQFKQTVNGLSILNTTFSPFAIIYSIKSDYNLSYDANGGTGTPLSQSVPMDSLNRSVTVTASCPERDGFAFKGWSTSAEGSVQYQPGDTVILNSDLTLYAVWAKEIPKTGDSSQPLLWLTLMVASLLALTRLTRTRKRNA